MELSDVHRVICERVVNVFETDTIKGKYGAISIYNDGPHRIRQITYGKSQTTEYGNLARLVDMYVKAGGTYSSDLAPYVKLIGNRPLVDNNEFKALLRQAGERDPVMWATQDRFFDLAYFQPALKWAEANGFTLPLSMLVIYDSFIHGGGILSFLRSRFPEMTPTKGGDEKSWVLAMWRFVIIG
jgi:chitosanase